MTEVETISNAFVFQTGNSRLQRKFYLVAVLGSTIAGTEGDIDMWTATNIPSKRRPDIDKNFIKHQEQFDAIFVKHRPVFVRNNCEIPS